MGRAALRGRGVLVPFGRRLIHRALSSARPKRIPSHKKILPIRQILDEEISLSGKSLDFL